MKYMAVACLAIMTNGCHNIGLMPLREVMAIYLEGVNQSAERQIVYVNSSYEELDESISLIEPMDNKNCNVESTVVCRESCAPIESQ